MSVQPTTMLHQLRHQKPIVLCLTNVVTMDIVANGLLALGAAPIMSLCEAELHQLVTLAQAIYLNIGTLDEAFIQRCDQVLAVARQYGKPVVLDPVGAGASSIRTKTARHLLSQVDIVKGNASEVMALLDDDMITSGVESSCHSSEALISAQHIAKRYAITVVVTGAVDQVVNKQAHVQVTLGDVMMSKVTGMGCLLGALIAAFAAIEPDTFHAAHYAVQLMGQCGIQAAAQAQGPGSFRSHFIDALSQQDGIQPLEQTL